MEYILVLFMGIVMYVLFKVEGAQLRLAKDVAELREELNSLSQAITDARDSIENRLDSLIENITSDDVKIKNLVKMGFPEDVAWDYIKLGAVGGPPSDAKK